MAPFSFLLFDHNQIKLWEQPSFIVAALFLYNIYFFFSHFEKQRNIVSIVNFTLLITLTITFIIVSYFPISVNIDLNPVIYSLTGAICIGGILYLINLPSKIFNKQDFLGEGDIKLFIVIGAFIGGTSSYKILIIWLYLAASFASVLIFSQVIKKPIQKSEKIFGGVFLMIMLVGLLFVSYMQIMAFNKIIFIIGVSLFLSASFCYFLLAKKWSDLKIVSKGFPMAPFISIAALTYLFYLENITLKFKNLGHLF